MHSAVDRTVKKTSGNGHHREPFHLGPPPPPPEPPSEDPPGKPPRPERKDWRGTIGWLVISALLLAYLLWPRPDLPAEPLVNVDARRSLGTADAAVTLEYYSDFGCPVCRNISTSGVLQQAIAANPGRLRIVWRDFPDAPQSRIAAEAALCASDQGAFWPYHDRLFADLSAHSPDDLKGYAKELGLDTVVFAECLDSGRHWPEVLRDSRAARRTDRAGPPIFIVDGEVRFTGPPLLSDLQEMVDSAVLRRSH